MAVIAKWTIKLGGEYFAPGDIVDNLGEKEEDELVKLGAAEKIPAAPKPLDEDNVKRGVKKK